MCSFSSIVLIAASAFFLLRAASDQADPGRVDAGPDPRLRLRRAAPHERPARLAARGSAASLPAAAVPAPTRCGSSWPPQAGRGC